MAEELSVGASDERSNSESRWTCEACGCHTNTETENPSNCSICGTSRRGPSWLSGGSDPSASARRLMMRLELFGRHDEPHFSLHDASGDEMFEDFNGMDEDLEDDDEEEEDMPSDHLDEDPSARFSFNQDDRPTLDHQIADMLSAAGVTDAAFAVRNLVLERRSGSTSQNNSVDAPRRSPRLQLRRQGDAESESASLISLAEENAAEFNPLWARNNNMSMTTRPRPLPSFYTDIYDGGPSHVHVFTKGERVVRSNVHVPTTTKVYGFRFAIDSLVTRDEDLSLRFIIGLAPSPSSFHISDGAIGLGLFWGIDDSGRVIESRLDFIQSILNQGDQNIVLSGNSPVGRRTSNSNVTRSTLDSFANTLHAHDLPRRSIGRPSTGMAISDVNDSLAIIFDNSTRLITFMKGDIIVGSTTKLVPPSLSLYPVAFLYEAGHIVAITGLHKDPMTIIRDFKVKMLRKKQQRLEEREQQIIDQRSRLIFDGQPTPALEEALRSIFSWYVQDENATIGSTDSLGPLSAARLWYRCGLKLSHLHGFLQSERMKKTDSDQLFRITFVHFFNAVCSVINSENSMNMESFQIGDEVEVVEDYEMYPTFNNSDAFNAGDRGTVVDLRYEGDLRLLKVRCGDKRPSWIESGQVYSEKSGLTESSCLRFLTTLLRRHAYDPSTLKSRVGSCLSDASWKAGDLVAMTCNKVHDSSLNLIGRVCETIKSTTNTQANASKLTVEFPDSAALRNCGMTILPQRISSGLLSSMSLTNCNPSALVYVGLKSGLFGDQSLNEGAIFDDVEDGEAYESQVDASLVSKVTAIAKLDTLAITSIRSMILEDKSIISKLSSHGLLDSIFHALERVYTTFVDYKGTESIVRNIDVHIFRALLHLVYMICREIHGDENAKSHRNSAELISHFEGEPMPIAAAEDEKSITRLYLRGKDLLPIEDTYSWTQDAVRIASLIERGLLCNDSRWVSKVVGKSNLRNVTSAVSNVKSLKDDDGDSLLYLAISFGCSTNILKHLIKAGCTVTNRDIKVAACTAQSNKLSLLLRHSSYYDGSLDLNTCPLHVREILIDAFSRQQKENSHLTNMGNSFTSKTVSKIFQILYAIYDDKRAQETAKLLLGALFGNISPSEEPFNVKMLGDTIVSSRSGTKQVLQSSSFFHLIPQALMSESIIYCPDQKSGTTLPLKSCLNLLESLLCANDRQENYAGFILAYHLTNSEVDLSSENWDSYGFHHLLLLHKNRIEKECKENIHGLSFKADVVRCPQGHDAVVHVTDKNSYRCDLCDRAIKIGKVLHGCRVCDWDVCELCLKDNESKADTTKMNDVISKAYEAITKRYSSHYPALKLDHETKGIVKGIRNMDRDSLRLLAVRLNNAGQVPLFTFTKIFLPAIYSSVITCIENRNHPPTILSHPNRISRRKKPRIDLGVIGTATDDFLQVMIEEMIIPKCKNSNVDPSVSLDPLRVENDGSYDETPISPERSSMPPFLRMLHKVLAVFEECSVSRYVCSKQFELESLSVPFTLELSFVPSAGEEIKDTIRAEPTVTVSDIRKYIMSRFLSIDSKYLAYCERLPSSHIIIAETSCHRAWKIARVLAFDVLTGNHIICYADNRRGATPSSTHGKSLTLLGAPQSTKAEISAIDGISSATRSTHHDQFSSLQSAEPAAWTLASEMESFNPVFRSSIKEYSGGAMSSDFFTLKEMFDFGGEKHSVNLSSREYFLIDEQQLWLKEFSEELSFSNVKVTGSENYGVLKRSWSALSLAEESSSTDANISTDFDFDFPKSVIVGNSGLEHVLSSFSVLFPPKLSVGVSLMQSLVTFPLEPFSDQTLFNLLHTLTKENSMSLQDMVTQRRARLVLNVRWSPIVAASRINIEESSCNTARQSSLMPEGLNDVSATVIHLFSIIHAQLKRGCKYGERAQGSNDILRNCEVDGLNKKLLSQLNDPLTVVCNSMPDWCKLCPCQSPMIFSHSVRRLLLERAYFGVSRSIICQQEAKVSVSVLRTQMSRLRSRAVELVAEAFSGCVDPTALQHQADELYSLEEAIKIKISSVFAGQRWQERSLKRARAVVCRESIVCDAAKVMEYFVNNPETKMRRLEVRFSGESGFDASDEEAGVTRGFYADLAEALLSCCPVSIVSQTSSELSKTSGRPGICQQTTAGLTKVYLWIADTDPSQQIIIPTPRADPSSTLGIYPRPICPTNTTRLEQVLPFFKLMGRIFASAMRDKFIFPLPLSSSFLKLVQGGTKCKIQSFESGRVYADSRLCDDLGTINDDRFILDSYDLPRPSFLGGEIFAAEEMCKRLNELENLAHLLTKEEYDKRKHDLESDRSFATKVMGARFEASFSEWFEGKRFVDPFDPAQDTTSTPLCPRGYYRSVTIDNIREWAMLAKKFVLYDGVIAQALAFREGVNDLFSVDALLLFTPEELLENVCGGGDNVHQWDEKAIRSLLKLDVNQPSEADGEIGNEDGLIRRFSSKSSTILYLIRALLEAKVISRRQFLSFVTSLPICTPGKIEVVPIIGPSGEFLSFSECCLPRANTCGRRLYLPFFKNYEDFHSIFWSVISEECKFKGFFEWRG